jgi:hypothetical protein
MQVADIARGIKEREKTDPKIDLRVADPACWKADGGPSHAEIMLQHGVAFRAADNSRVSGWSQVRDRLDGEDGQPMLYTFDTCGAFIRTMPALQHDDHHPEDIDSDGEDHAADEARYAMMARPWTRRLKTVHPLRGMHGMTMNEVWKLGAQKTASGRI